MTLEASQDIECPRHHLNHIALACQIAGKHSLFAKSFRASSHFYGSIPLCGIKFHLQNKLPQAICRHNRKPFARAIVVDGPENGMRGRIYRRLRPRVRSPSQPEEWARRQIAFVGVRWKSRCRRRQKLKALLVKLDDVIAQKETGGSDRRSVAGRSRINLRFHGSTRQSAQRSLSATGVACIPGG
jgi:hypothetical protein